MHVAEFILGLFSLIEAEGRLLRFNVIRLTSLVSLLILGFIFAAAGLFFFLGALYKTLNLFMDAPFSFLIMGTVSSGVGLILIWSATKCRNRKKEQTKKA